MYKKNLIFLITQKVTVIYILSERLKTNNQFNMYSFSSNKNSCLLRFLFHLILI